MDSQRCIELVVQLLALLAGGGAFVAALFTEIKFKELSDFNRGLIESASNFLDQNELFLKTEAMAGIVFGVTGVAVIVGLISSIGRICRPRHTKSNYRIFSCLYLLYCLFCFLGYATAGILGVFTAMDWWDITSLGDRFRVSTSTVDNLRNSVTATAACSLFAALMYALLQVVVLFCCAAVKDY